MSTSWLRIGWPRCLWLLVMLLSASAWAAEGHDLDGHQDRDQDRQGQEGDRNRDQDRNHDHDREHGRNEPSAPVLAPSPGCYDAPVPVEVDGRLATGERLVYTVDGTAPSGGAWLVDGPIVLTDTTTMRVGVIDSHGTLVRQTEGVYVITSALTTARPVAQPPAGTYTAPLSVSLSCATSGATIRLTTDGSEPTSRSSRYTAPLTLVRTTTLRAKAFGGTVRVRVGRITLSLPAIFPSGVMTSVYTVQNQSQQVATPTITPASGLYRAMIQAQASDGTAGATLRYRTDGADPTVTDPVVPTGGVAINQSQTLTVRGFLAGWTSSAVARATYTLQVPEPSITPASGSANAPMAATVTIPTGSTVRYTLDGTDPSAASPAVSGPIVIDHSLQLRAQASATGWTPSAVVAATYTLQALVPTVSLPAGAYVGPQQVTLSDATTGVVIHYTLDGTPPTATSPTATGPITLPGSCTLSAIASRTGWSDSAAITAVYALQVQSITASLAAGSYVGAQTVSLASATAGASIAATLDGSDPAISGSAQPVSGPIALPGSCTLRAIATRAGWSASVPFSAAYTLQVPTPSIAPDQTPVYHAPITVTASDADSAAILTYILAGGTSQPLPPAGIFLSQSASLTVVASRSGWQTSNPASATYQITLPPQISAGPAAAPASVSGTSTTLAVSASDPAGGALSYQWSADPSAPAVVNFTTPGAASTTATFTAPGLYPVLVTVTNPVGLSVSGTVQVTVTAAPAVLQIAPTTAAVMAGQTQAFAVSATDQFQHPIAVAAVWSCTGAGSIDQNGLFTAGSSAGTASVSAQVGALAAQASVTVTSPPVTNTAPTIATAPAADGSMGPQIGLSVLGTDDGGEANLIYTWSTTGTPPAGVAFSANGTNAAKTLTATFAKAGAYGFQVRIIDTDGLSVTSGLTVTVNQTSTSVAVSPATADIVMGAAQAFTATANDQFGIAMASQPGFTWGTTGGGAFTGNVFTASLTTGGPYTVTGTGGGTSGTATVMVVNAAPTVATAASATPSPVTGTTTTLSALGADDGGEPNLTYTWTATIAPAPVVYSLNGTNAAKSTVATFTTAGTYVFQVTIADKGSKSVVGYVTVPVNQTFTSVAVAPGTASVATGLTQAFVATAQDQFGAALAVQPAVAWATTGGSISAAGLFTAPATAGGPYTVTGTASVSGTQFSGQAQVTVRGNAAPTIATAPMADGESGPQIQLSVLGADDGGEANLTYTWSQADVPATIVFPSGNGSNASKTVVATFPSLGTYHVSVAISDKSGAAISPTLTVLITGRRPIVPPQVIPCESDSSNVMRDLQATSPDYGGASITIVTPPANGTAIITGVSLYYAPNPGFVGVDPFIVTANDGNSTSLPATITMMVGIDQARSVLERNNKVEVFDAARWSTDLAYRSSYLALSIPGRVWATAPGAAGVPRLVLSGAASVSCQASATLSIQVQGAPNAPVSFMVTGNGSFQGGVSAITVQSDVNGIAATVFTAPAMGCRCPVLIGSPQAVGTKRIVVEVQP